MTRNLARHRRGATALVALAVVMGLTACGNRASIEELAAANAAANAPAQVVQAAVPNAATTTQTAPTTDGAAPTSTDAGTAPAPGTATAPVDGSTQTTTTATTGTKPSAGHAKTDTGAKTTTSTGKDKGAVCVGSKAPIVIGTVGQQSGIVGAAVFPGVQAMQAWIAAKNLAGGIDCHPIKYVVADDGGDPSRHLALAKKLVEQEKIIAFVYMDAVLSGQASADYVKQKRVPVLGQEGGSTYFHDSPMHFSAGSNGVGLIDLMIAGTAQVVKPLGKTKAATITCVEATWCNLAHSRWPTLGSKYGLDFVYQAKASLTQPDFTAQCLAAQSAGAQVILGAFDPSAWKRIGGSCAQVGYKPIFSAPVAQTRYDFVDDPNLEGMIVPEPNMPWFITSNPSIAEFNEIAAKFAKNMKLDARSLAGWSSAKLFERAATGHMSDTPTSQDILDGLWTIKNDTLGGISAPLTFPKNKPGIIPVCGWPVIIKSGKWTNDGKMQCYK